MIEITDTLIRSAQGGDHDAMWTIVSAHDAIIASVIQDVAPAAGSADREDLMQEARAALIQHLYDYDTEASTAKLATYAYRGIRGAVADAWTHMRSGVSVEPSTLRTVRKALADADGDVGAAWKAVSEGLDVGRRLTWQRFRSALEALPDPLSLTGPAHSRGAGGDEKVTLADVIPSTDAVDVSQSIHQRTTARFLLGEIAPRRSLALRVYYGIGMTQMEDAEAASTLGVRPSTLRALRTRGIESARKVAAAHGIAA
ncbi:sigma factor [Streptomyces sp. NPDC020141]|uniref:sigma factor n=1 Tax=Streptomyces sp. NPDC020141 TaxID=3365065 RepID=UPI00379933A6